MGELLVSGRVRVYQPLFSLNKALVDPYLKAWCFSGPLRCRHQVYAHRDNGRIEFNSADIACHGGHGSCWYSLPKDTTTELG